MEPLVLRANANDCIALNFHNLLSENEKEPSLPDSSGDALMPKIVPLNVDKSADPNADDIKPSARLSISIPMLPSVGFTNYHNIGIGMNRSMEPVPGGRQINLRLYAGRLELDPGEKVKGVPVCDDHEECSYTLNRVPYAFGTIPIKAFGDVIGHGTHGLFGTLIIEPEGATYHDPKTGALVPDNDRWSLGSEALIKYTDEKGKMRTFREFVIAYQDGLNLHWNPPWNSANVSEPIGDCPICDDSYDHGEKGLNYRTAPFWSRLRHGIDINGNVVNHSTDAGSDLNQIKFPNNFLLESWAKIPTPIFQAKVGEEVRFRIVQPHGRARQRAFLSFGHDYQDEIPHFGSAHAALLSAGKSVTAVLSGTAKEGCYLYRDGPMHIFAGGVWGHFRVNPVDGATLKCAQS